MANDETVTRQNIGTKAKNLFFLREKGFLVPFLFCVSEEEQWTREQLNEKMGDWGRESLLAIRSSTNVEDGTHCSFAGQFDTYLNVKWEEAYERVQELLNQKTTPGMQQYCRQNGIDPDTIQMTVIIQKMVESELSGVMFTANPQGLLNESVIVVGKGNGNLVVEDKVDTTTYYYNNTDAIYYYEATGESPKLTRQQLEELIVLGNRIRESLGYECDIEYAIAKEQIFVLQARPITTITQADNPIVLDNSNIVESYPDITLPLTQSFIREVYYQIFRSLVNRLTKNDPVVESMDEILRNMVDVANGRVYYRISNWYDVILLLPFRKKIIPVWQEMLGVQTKTVSTSLKKPICWQTRGKVTLSFFELLRTCPKKMTELDHYFLEILEFYSTLKLKDMKNEELLTCYQKLMDMVMKQWDITLVNDMYSFLYTALLKKCLKGKMQDYEEATRQYISQIADIESLQPIKEIYALAQRAKNEKMLESLQLLVTNEDYRRFQEKNPCDFINEVEHYIETYGDRNIEELKLESMTFRTDPILLIRRILQYAEGSQEYQGVDNSHKRTELKGLSGKIARKAALGIRNREKSRMNRGRLYGMMRSLMLQLGSNLAQEHILSEQRDIFWLYETEIRRAIAGETMDCQTIIKNRKQQYRMYRELPAYSRLIFANQVIDKNPLSIYEMTFDEAKESYKGVACSGGVVEGEVMVIEQPSLMLNTQGKILVTKMTDPGWVFLIAQALGVIAEKGSLLSHTAIISRELGKTAVVNVKNITRLLHNGDYVRVDGNLGEITIVKKKGETNEKYS